MFTDKNTYLFIVIFLGCIGFNSFTVNGKDFYAAYKQYIIKDYKADHYGTISKEKEKAFDLGIGRVKQTLDVFEKMRGHPIFYNDTVCIIDLIDKKIWYTIIWNGKESCYNITKRRRVGEPHSIRFHYEDKSFKIYSDALNVLKKFPADCKQWILNADSLNFTDHAKEEKILNYTWLQYKRAVRKNGKREFVAASSLTIYDDTLTPDDEKLIKESYDRKKKGS